MAARTGGTECAGPLRGRIVRALHIAGTARFCGCGGARAASPPGRGCARVCGADRRAPAVRSRTPPRTRALCAACARRPTRRLRCRGQVRRIDQHAAGGRRRVCAAVRARAPATGAAAPGRPAPPAPHPNRPSRAARATHSPHGLYSMEHAPPARGLRGTRRTERLADGRSTRRPRGSRGGSWRRPRARDAHQVDSA